MTTPPFNPLPCDAGAQGASDDVESHILCALDANGSVLATALAVYTYGPDGNPVGAPEFVDPITGDPFVQPPGTTMQPCPNGDCGGPIQFCQTGTTTGPVQHPGRQYDITLPLNPGFAVQSLAVDAVTHSAGITWEVDDPDGEAFRVALTNFMEGRLPAAAVVTITNPNAGQTICGTAAPMQVHIECLRLDQTPPDLIELVYNAGQDMVINPAYNETPPLNPPVAQGNYGFHLLGRQDNNTYPGNPPAGRANCTDVANRGWETNDAGRTFEIWGVDQTQGQNVTPTPRGTPVQEIASDGAPGTGRPSTIWQTFQAPASGNFIIRVVHGSRDPGEQHRITLDNGDTDDQQNGHLIDDVTNPPSVTVSGGPNPWTTFNQTIPLTAGQTYTLALSVSNNGGGARGGLFTDMRAYIDRPDQRATATTDDDTCVVTTEETQTTTTCSFWQPQCTGGRVDGWVRVDTGLVLSNAQFWAQTPTPSCCGLNDGGEDGGNSSTLSNLAVSDVVCATIGGIPRNVVRQVVLDPSGGQLSQQFLGTDGAPVEPTTWNAGPCSSERFVQDVVLCDVQADGNRVPFLRKYIQSLSETGQGQINSHRDFVLDGSQTYTTTGTVALCETSAPTAQRDVELSGVCDFTGGVFVHVVAVHTYDGAGSLLSTTYQTPAGTPYVPTGVVTACPNVDVEVDRLCDSGAANNPFLRVHTYVDGVHTGTADRELDGTTPYNVVGAASVCGTSDSDPIATTGLCLADGTPIAVVTRRDATTGAVTQDGWVNLTTGAFTAGNPPVGTVACGESRSIQVTGVFCDVTAPDTINGLVLIEYSYNPDGTIASVRLVNATTGATYTPVGTITVCPTGTDAAPEQDAVVLCDDTGSFVRDFRRDETGAIIGFSNYTLAGAAYTPTGTVRVCSSRDSETVILCDSAAVPNRFARTYTYDAAGAIAGFTDRTLAGAAFTPTGAVGVCAPAAEVDVAEEILCDSNGTQFIRRFVFNGTTGAVTSTTNVTLAGAAFTPVGTVGVCSDCCPVVVGQGCTNTGSGRYVAIRAANGTITLQDAVTGAAVTQAQIIACPDQPVTLTAQQRLVADADAAWTPGADVAGTLTSVTFTVLSGTATVTDQNGTVAAGLPAGLTVTWNAEDHDTLSGPQSIDAVGGQVYVNWTQR